MTTKAKPTKATSPKNLTPLHQETRLFLTTAEAAAHLNRKPQTLRGWSCKSPSGMPPIKGKSMHGRLMWSVQEIKAFLGVSE